VTARQDRFLELDGPSTSSTSGSGDERRWHDPRAAYGLRNVEGWARAADITAATPASLHAVLVTDNA
jgi:hypothetical protein